MRQSAPLLSTLCCAYLCYSCAAPQQGGARSAFDERQGVGELIASFSSSVAQRDFRAMSALFAEDAIWETSAGTLGFRHEGRPVIHAWLTSNPGHVEVVFYLASEPTVELLSLDRARAQTSITELLRFQDSGEIKQLFGVYTDELVKQAGEWRFAHRRFTLRHMTTMKQPDRR